MEDNNQLSFPDEDEDLEALRLAALQSLKKKSNNDAQQMAHFGSAKDKMNHFNGSPRGRHKRGKFPRPQQGRQTRNGQFNSWTRNTNLIAVPMIAENEKPAEVKKTLADDVPKLVLPQDRYCKIEKSPEKTDTSSKFDRYDNSNSESESEEEEEEEEKSQPELKRSTSLEVLMAELENEIQGVSSKPPPEEKPKVKQVKKKRKVSVTAPPPSAPAAPETDSKPVLVLKENLKPEPNFPRQQRKWQAKPPPRRHNFVPPPLPVVHHPPVVAFAPPPVQTFAPFNPIGFDNGVYVPPPVVFEAPPPQLPPMHVAPPPPLVINTDAYSTTLAPLSPRSAAFVMENRAIIEKRKRRSYSRSPSPPPLRFRRSKSPKRLSMSPKRRSLSPSPVRKVLPPRTSSPKKPPVHDRLGLKSANKTESQTTTTTTEEEKTKKKEEKKEVLDPVLEARRRKFERNVTATEGVIRLKKAEDEQQPKKEGEEEEGGDIDEDALLEGDVDDAILLDHHTLFSDEEESDSDNEGRFKTKQESNQKVAVLPFTKLINGAKCEVKHELTGSEREKRKVRRSRSPVKKLTTPKKSEKGLKQPMGKIEIKIRNPAKYEKVEGESERKVEVEIEGAVSESIEDANLSEGDLRAQLSRKRAERQKHPLPDVVPSRLLQNALQGVGFRKGKKAKSAKDEASEGKLPIHLRLGAANGSEVFGKKSRKHKNKGSQEQVLCFVASFLIIIFSLLNCRSDSFYSLLFGKSIHGALTFFAFRFGHPEPDFFEISHDCDY